MKNLFFIHSAKGSTWGDHKYIKKVGNTYVYPEDVAKGSTNKTDAERYQKTSRNVNMTEYYKKQMEAMQAKKEEAAKATIKNEETKTEKSANAEHQSEKKEFEWTSPERKEGMVDIANDELGADGYKQIAKLVIGGMFGDAEQQKKMLGKNYSKIMVQVESMMKNGYDKDDIKAQVDKANKLMSEKIGSKSSTKLKSETVDAEDKDEDENKKSKKKKKSTSSNILKTKESNDADKLLRHSFGIELYHHGRLGQRWGKKNGPPYPLNFDDLSDEERSKAKEKTIRNADIRTAAANKKHFSNDDIDQIIKRFGKEQELEKLNKKIIDSGRIHAMESIDKLSESMGTISKFIDNGTKVYNSTVKVTNSLYGTNYKFIKEANKDGGEKKKDK